MHNAKHYKKLKLKTAKDMVKVKGNPIIDGLEDRVKKNSVAKHKF